MAFPSLAKTWQISPNNTMVLQATAALQGNLALKTIKDKMVAFSTNPWTVQFSSNAGNNGAASAASGAAGSAGDLVDRWTNVAQTQGAGNTCDINWVGEGSRHSWMVLRQTGIATNFEVLLDCNSNFSTGGWNGLSILVSYSAGFTGGSATARPTATDEKAILGTGATTGGVNWGSAAAAQTILHAWQSSDGQVTRIALVRGGANICTYWEFGKAQNPSSGWTNPCYAVAPGVTTAGSANSYAAYADAANINCIGAGATPQFAAGHTYETYISSGSGLMRLAGAGTAANSFDGQWPVLPIGMAANATGGAGRIGNIYDLWWRPSGIANGDTFPNNAATRQFVVLGDFIFPWIGDSTQILLA